MTELESLRSELTALRAERDRYRKVLAEIGGMVGADWATKVAREALDNDAILFQDNDATDG